MKFIQSILRGFKQRLDRVNDLAPGARVDQRAWVSGSTLGPQVRVAEGCKIHKSLLTGSVEVARFTTLWGPDIYLAGGANGIHIGAFCSVAHHVSMHESFHNAQRTTTYFVERNLLGTPHPPEAEITLGPIIIGNDVWIGAGAAIMSGVTVGDGAIIGAGSIVTRDVPAYTIVAGNPATVRRARFPREVTVRLLASQWWTWPEDRLRAEADFLTELHDRGE